MKTWLKRVLISLVVVFIVALVGAAIFLLTFDPNSYKTRLEEIVYKRYERSLRIDGDIELSLFPRIGLAVQNVALSERNQDTPFASVDSARLAVAIWPLLFNRLVVDHISLTGLKAWVVRESSGDYNFDDIVHGPQLTLPLNDSTSSSAKPSKAKTALQIDIAGLELKEGEVHVFDAISGVRSHFSQLEVSTGRMTFEQPFDLTLKARMKGGSPKADARLQAQAQIQFDPLARRYEAQRIELTFDGMLDQLDTKSLSLNIAQLRIDHSRAELALNRVALRSKGNLKEDAFELAVDAPSIAISPQNAKGEPVSASLKLSHNDAVFGTNLKISGLSGNAYNLSAKEWKLESAYKEKEGKRVVGLEMHSPANWSPWEGLAALTELKGELRIDDKRLPEERGQLPFIGRAQADFHKSELMTALHAVTGGNNIDIKVQVKNLLKPYFKVALEGGDIDLNNFFPFEKDANAKPEASKEVAETANETSTPPVVALSNMSFLNNFQLDANIHLEGLRFKDFRLKGLQTALQVKEGLATLDLQQGRLFDGQLEGRLSASAENQFVINLDAKKISLQPLSSSLYGRPLLQGNGDIEMRLSSQGITQGAVLAELDGEISLHAAEGAWIGIDLNQNIEQAREVLRNAFSGQVPQINTSYDVAKKTPFDLLDVKLTFKQGQGEINNLYLAGPYMAVWSQDRATLDLVNQRLDVILNLKRLPGKPGTEAVGQNELDLTGIVLPVRVSGPFASLSYDVVWKDIHDFVIQDVVQKGLIDVLTQSGGDVADSFRKKPGPESDSDASSADALKSLGKVLKGLLKP